MKELVFHNRHGDYIIDKYYFQKDKRSQLMLMTVDTKNNTIVLSNKTPYGNGANKYYIG